MIARKHLAERIKEKDENFFFCQKGKVKIFDMGKGEQI